MNLTLALPSGLTLRGLVARWLERQWYGSARPNPLLLPLEAIYRGAVKLRKQAFAAGLRGVERLPIPVVVVGNISVGGTGKTPLTIWLAKRLRELGYRPGIVSRGYGGRTGSAVVAVDANSDPAVVGDEPVLLARRAGCPVRVARRRADAARALLTESQCDLILADDGLQHYALGRDIEIAVVDGQRGLGNRHCLPAGPLREEPERLAGVDLVVQTGRRGSLTVPAWPMELEGAFAVNLRDEGQRRRLTTFAGKRVHAVAAIGNPERFFAHLQGFEIDAVRHGFPDHHPFRAEDLEFSETLPVLMTEKDAVKCRPFAGVNHWYVPVEANLPSGFADALSKLLNVRHHGSKTVGNSRLPSL